MPSKSAHHKPRFPGKGIPQVMINFFCPMRNSPRHGADGGLIALASSKPPLTAMLETIATAPPDPILGLTEAFTADSNPDKVNLGVGIYKDAEGNTPTLECIREAARLVAEKQGSGGGYLPITGLAAYDQLTVELLFGSGSAAVAEGRVVAAQRSDVQRRSRDRRLSRNSSSLTSTSPVTDDWSLNSESCRDMASLIR